MKSQSPHKSSLKPSSFIGFSPLAQQFIDSQRRIESKLDELLYLLKGAPHLNEQTFKDAIRESLCGNRKPLEDYLSKGGKVPEITA